MHPRGVHRSRPHRGVRRDPGLHSNTGRLHTANYPVVYRPGVLGLTILAHRGWPCAPERQKVLRLDRDPTAEARSPPARSACSFSHPVQMSQRGVRAAAAKACLVIYND